MTVAFLGPQTRHGRYLLQCSGIGSAALSMAYRHAGTRLRGVSLIGQFSSNTGPLARPNLYQALVCRSGSESTAAQPARA